MLALFGRLIEVWVKKESSVVFGKSGRIMEAQYLGKYGSYGLENGLKMIVENELLKEKNGDFIVQCSSL